MPLAPLTTAILAILFPHMLVLAQPGLPKPTTPQTRNMSSGNMSQQRTPDWTEKVYIHTGETKPCSVHMRVQPVTLLGVGYSDC